MQQSNTITIDTNKTLDSFKKGTNQKLSKPMKATTKQTNETLSQMIATSKKSSSKKTKLLTPDIPVKSQDLVKKEDLIRVILKYEGNERFGGTLKKELGFKHTRNQLTKLDVDDLEVILHRIRTHLNTRNMDQVFNHMVKQSAKGYEDIVTGFGYDIRGFEEILLSNPAFWDAFERWKIEQKIPDVPPSLQLMYLVASTTFIAHKRNTILDEKKSRDDTIIPRPPLKKRTQPSKDIEIIDSDDE